MARKSLADELQSLINPEPSFVDPEDDENLDGNWIDSDDRAHQAGVTARSELRNKQVSILSSVNKKYSGKTISRKDLFGSYEDDINYDDEDNDEDGDEDDDEDEDEDDDETNGIDNGDDDEQDFDMDEEEGDEDDDDELEELDDEEMMKTVWKRLNDHKKVSFKDDDEGDEDDEDGDNDKDDDNDDDSLEILQFDAEQQFEKASTVKSQILLYDNLLDTRIKMQKLLQNCNRLPPATNLLKLLRKKNKQMEESLTEAVKGVRKLGKVLLEIDSFIHLEESSQNDDSQAPENFRKRKLEQESNYDEGSLSKRFSSISSKYGAIIDSWHEKTRFVNANVKLKKFENFDIAPTKAIQQILNDKERLIAKTRQRRSQFVVVGQSDGDEDKIRDKNKDKEEDEGEEFSKEIFDDEDFYHQLLKQIIENKMGSVEETSSASRKFMEIQRMRNKLKKVVETRASKGRKIRYNVHEKLVNFMAPVDRTTMEDNAKDKLFKALFGTFKMDQVN